MNGKAVNLAQAWTLPMAAFEATTRLRRPYGMLTNEREYRSLFDLDIFISYGVGTID